MEHLFLSGIGIFRIAGFLIGLGIISYIDIREYRIPDMILILITIVLVGCDLVLYCDQILHRLAGAGFAFLVFYGTHKATKGMGLGDVKLSILMGYALGIRGFIFAVLCASALGIVFFFIGRFFFNMSIRRKIPFAPFLAFGSLASIILFYFQPSLFSAS